MLKRNSIRFAVALLAALASFVGGSNAALAGGLWRRYRDRRNGPRSLERISRHTFYRGKSDYIGLRRRPQDNHRRHGSYLEACHMKSFSLISQPAEVWATAWSVIFQLLQSGVVKPIVAKTFPLAEAADALRYLVEGRPFGRVVLTI